MVMFFGNQRRNLPPENTARRAGNDRRSTRGGRADGCGEYIWRDEKGIPLGYDRHWRERVLRLNFMLTWHKCAYYNKKRECMGEKSAVAERLGKYFVLPLRFLGWES